jgi:hypothetical protein
MSPSRGTSGHAPSDRRYLRSLEAIFVTYDRAKGFRTAKSHTLNYDLKKENSSELNFCILDMK